MWRQPPFPGMVSWKTPVLAGLLCAHCALTALSVALATGLAAVPAFFGVNLAYVLPPVLLLGAFLLWVLWTGRTGSASCPVDVAEK